MSGEVSSADLELGVQGIMSLMEPSYPEGRTSNAESMRRLLFAAAVALVHASGTVDDRERNVFEQFFGANSLGDKLNIERTIATLEDRAATVLENTTGPAYASHPRPLRVGQSRRPCGSNRVRSTT